ncbi:hypothetical protein GMORB2_7293 [Geosmithia morbida]|uniref:Nucleotidyltransferase n=1 Tax=Geosmithia morbida TaxID=1094350 RepID=A0A9P4YSH5_9HYPO|nr:uncharacterized protein GMORB2_7293 [Geosmithia morbida]KAF4122301.1 hypothetical protein GMORB2_7293 [Geosmithia morbida]
MGGKAFTAGPDPLYTPRMPEPVYAEQKSRCHDILRGYFDVVDSPIDGPDKEDFGDIDVLVCGPKNTKESRQELFEAVSKSLGAVKVIIVAGQIQLAVPWPSHRKDEDSAWFIQIDVQVCADRESMKWMLFKHSHGDIWSMIGSMIRPYGLTVDDHTLSVRIPEIEEGSRKLSKVPLTSEPDEVLEFLNLSPLEYWKGPFKSFDAMAEYVTSCPMFWVSPDSESGSTLDVGTDGIESTGGGTGEIEKAGGAGEAVAGPWSPGNAHLKSNEHRRMNQRPSFRRWVDEFRPQCRRSGRFIQERTTREKVTDEALATFGAADRYYDKLHSFRLQEQKDLIWNGIIKKAIPAPEDKSDHYALQRRGIAIKALRRIIADDSLDYGISRPADVVDENGLFVIYKVKEFIEKIKEDVLEAAEERHRKSYMEKAKKEAPQEE